MVEKKDFDRLTRSLELLDTACEAAIELAGLCTQKKSETAIRLAQDLCAVDAAIRNSGVTILPAFEHAYTAEQLENVEDTLENIKIVLQANEYGRGAEFTEFQLLPFLRQLREAFYFWGTVYPDKERMDRYYREEFAEHYKNWYVGEDNPLPYRLSVVVVAYNHLETTKQCIEHLLRETDFEQLNAELILIDHGSTDGTLDYFESLGIGKVIHFKRNVRMNMFCMIGEICKADYFAFVSNDVLVTHNWANNLLKCMNSDASVIAAVPITPNTSNLQWMQVAPDNPDDFVAWAAQRNASDASLWDERSRLMPNLGMFQTRAVSKIGFADPMFYSMEFWDDDFSFRARRAGYRQLLCRDVACYHFGSVTGKEAQKKENTLVYGRELFRKKNGVDAWSNGFCYDYTVIQLLNRAFSQKNEITILGLDCGMGDTPLQIRNELRHFGRNGVIYQLTSQKEYLPDILSASKQALYAPCLSDGIASAFVDEQFDCIYLGRDIAQYEDYSDLLRRIADRLVKGGCLIFACENPFFAPNLHALLQFSVPGSKGRFVVVHPSQIEETAKKYFGQVQRIAVETPVGGVEQFVAQHYGKTKRNVQIAKELQIKQYYFKCAV